MDIVVTTPTREIANAAREAEECIANGGGYYFRALPTFPRLLRPGDRVYYTEAGYIWGFAIVDRVIKDTNYWTCDTTGVKYPPGVFVLMRADSWQWIKPIPQKGCRGFHYVKLDGVEIVGGWLDPRPRLSEVA